MNGVQTSGWFETNLDSCLVIIFLDGLTHYIGSLRCGSRFLLTSAGLYIIGSGIHGQDAGLLDVLGTSQQTCFQDYFHLLLATDGL